MKLHLNIIYVGDFGGRSQTCHISKTIHTISVQVSDIHLSKTLQDRCVK